MLKAPSKRVRTQIQTCRKKPNHRKRVPRKVVKKVAISVIDISCFKSVFLWTLYSFIFFKVERQRNHLPVKRNSHRSECLSPSFTECQTLNTWLTGLVFRRFKMGRQEEPKPEKKPKKDEAAETSEATETKKPNRKKEAEKSPSAKPRTVKAPKVPKAAGLTKSKAAKAASNSPPAAKPGRAKKSAQ